MDERKSYQERELVIKTENDYKTITKLSKHFIIRQSCPFDIGKYDNITRDSIYCPSTADYLFCFPSTPANQTVYYPCPYKEGIEIGDTEIKASKYCQPNGTWKDTNYLDCLKNLVVQHYSINCKFKKRLNDSSIDYNSTIECNDVEDNDVISALIPNLYLAGFLITLVAVTIALIIFCTIRSLRCLRNMVHSNLLMSYWLKSVIFIALWFSLKNYQTLEENVHNPLCMAFQLMWHYSLLTNFFWMMVEGIYLITVIVAAYSSNKIKLWWYLIIGWVLPLAPIIPFAILTITSKNQKKCNWLRPEYTSHFELFIDIPIYLVLLTNFVLLVIILYVLITKLKDNNDAIKSRYCQYKKLIRATIILFPLLGLTYVMFIWNPESPKSFGAKIYVFINIFFQTTQGIWVTFVYCFLNEEVQTVLRNKFRSWKSSQSILSLQNIMHRSARLRSRNQSVVTSSTYVRGRVNSNQTPPAQDPAIIPMLKTENENENENNNNNNNNHHKSNGVHTNQIRV